MSEFLTFEQWLNRPVYKAQVFTATICKSLLGITAKNVATLPNHPLMLLRVHSAYRCARSLALRKQVADHVRLARAVRPFHLPKVSP